MAVAKRVDLVELGREDLATANPDARRVQPNRPGLFGVSAHQR